ncbi:MAG: flagellar protein FliT [Burkholderiales bacterium]
MERDALSYYEEVAGASGRMLRAAQDSDWDALIEQEKVCAGLIEALHAADAARKLGGDALLRKAAIIRQVLAEDAEIRRLTQPWLLDLEQLLRASTNHLRLGDTYR